MFVCLLAFVCLFLFLRRIIFVGTLSVREAHAENHGMPPSCIAQCLSVQGFTLQLPVREEALLPSPSQSLALFSFPDLRRTCGLPHVRRHGTQRNSEAENGGGTVNTIEFGKCVAYQDHVVCEDSEIWYLCTCNTAPCLAVFCAVILQAPHPARWQSCGTGQKP